MGPSARTIGILDEAEGARQRHGPLIGLCDHQLVHTANGGQNTIRSLKDDRTIRPVLDLDIGDIDLETVAPLAV